VETSGEKAGGESLVMEEQELTAGPSLEAVEPPLVSSHGMSFWMFIVVCCLASSLSLISRFYAAVATLRVLSVRPSVRPVQTSSCVIGYQSSIIYLTQALGP